MVTGLSVFWSGGVYRSCNLVCLVEYRPRVEGVLRCQGRFRQLYLPRVIEQESVESGSTRCTTDLGEYEVSGGVVGTGTAGGATYPGVGPSLSLYSASYSR